MAALCTFQVKLVLDLCEMFFAPQKGLGQWWKLKFSAKGIWSEAIRVELLYRKFSLMDCIISELYKKH